MTQRLLVATWLCVAAWAQIPPELPGTEVPGLEVGKPLEKDKPASPIPPRPPARAGRGGAAVPEKPAGASLRDLKYPPLSTVQPPKLEVSTLPNGLKVYVAEQREFPIIGGAVMVRTGTAFDPPERIGLASIAGSLLRQGGTELKTGAQVDETLAQLGMSVDSSVGETAVMVTFTALARNAEPSLALLRELLTRPEFRQDRLDAAKTKLRDSIAHRTDDTPEFLRRELSGLIFGRSTPYGWQPDYAGIERITRTDLKKFHQRYFSPANMMLGVWGDFDASRVQAMVQKVFGDWPAGPGPAPEPPKASATPAPGIYLAEKPDASDGRFLIGQPGGMVNSKDYAALQVMARMFNRLQQRITTRARTRAAASAVRILGITVDDVRASWDAGFDHPGLFRVYGTCRAAATTEVLQAVLDDIEHMRTEEATDEELRIARSAVIDSFAASWDTGAKAFQRAMTLEYYGFPRDFPQRYQEAITAVTRADVIRVAKQYLNPAALTTLVIGNPRIFSVPLEKISPQVNRFDLTAPAPKNVVSESTDATIAEGKRILQRAQAAAGGVEKLEAVKDYAIASEFQLDPAIPEIGGSKVPQTDRWIQPSVFRQDISLPTGRISAYSDGKAGWISTRQGWGALTGAQLKQLQGDLFRSYFRFLMSDRIEGRTVNLVDQDLIEVTDATGQIARMEFDPKTGLPARSTYDVPQAAGPPLMTEDVYSDFREVAGIKIPFRTVITQGGRKFADVVLTDVRINSGIRQADLAVRPQ